MRNYIVLLLTIATIVSAVLSSCRKEAVFRSPEQIVFAELPYEQLSDYGFFKGQLSDLKPQETVLPYEPVSSLFSDYSHKSRFVWMPKGSPAKLLDNQEGEIEFENQTILIKNFYYPEDFKKPEGKRRIVETRLLVKLEGKWESYPYLWAKDQSEAKYKITGKTFPVDFKLEDGTAQHIDYIQPNKNQCKSCHNKNEVLKPIGPKLRNLDFPLDYGDGSPKNQMEKWAEFGYLKGYAGTKGGMCMTNYADASQPIEKRARAYLDINCGHCHSQDGPASTSGMFLTWEHTDPADWGVMKPPIAAGIGAGPHKYGILPGKADSSIMVHRMKSTQPAVAMPEIGRVMVDKEGVALISEWINQMPANKK